jgi:putative phosphoribosyl transferase
MTIEDLAEKERVELRRRQATYQGERPPVPVEGKTAILVDDGAATGATLLAAVRALRRRGPARVVLAVPVASVEALELLRPEVDEVLCLEVPQPFCAVGESYGTFPQVSDSQVLAILAAHPIPNAPPPTGHQTGPKGGEP